MNYVNKYLTACMVILMSGNHASSQANTSLSNLVSNLYVDGSIYLDDHKIMNKNGQSFFVGTTGASLNTGMHREITEGFMRASPAVLRDLERALHGQNIPVPFENSSLIPFRNPHDGEDASIAISESVTGKIVRVISLAVGETQWTLEAGFTIVVIILTLCLWMELRWIRKA